MCAMSLSALSAAISSFCRRLVSACRGTFAANGGGGGTLRPWEIREGKKLETKKRQMKSKHAYYKNSHEKKSAKKGSDQKRINKDQTHAC
jgi:hypothetical protein